MDGLGRAPVVTLPPLHQGPASIQAPLATLPPSGHPLGISTYASRLPLLPGQPGRIGLSDFCPVQAPTLSAPTWHRGVTCSHVTIYIYIPLFASWPTFHCTTAAKSPVDFSHVSTSSPRSGTRCPTQTLSRRASAPRGSTTSRTSSPRSGTRCPTQTLCR